LQALVPEEKNPITRVDDEGGGGEMAKDGKEGKELKD